MSDERQFVDDARRYALESRIATGGMGEVWRASDTVLGRTVAVKLLKPEYADEATFRARFETEAQHAASLHHPNVAAVFDFGEATPTDGAPNGRPFLVMELVDGRPLSDLLRPGQPLDAAATRALLAQAADALGAAHAAGIVHRDVKPANLLVTPDRTIKITDFGIARAAEGMALTETGQVMGTPQYLSPEQAQGGTANPASDVYSLGVVAFECLAGRRPFVAESAVATALAHLREPVPDLPADVPADLAAVVRKAMSKSPEDRFADGTELAAALRDPATAVVPEVEDSTRVMGGVAPVPVPPPTPAPTPDDDRRKRAAPWLWILLAVVVIAAVIGIIALATSGDDDPEPPTPSRSQTREESPTQETTQTEDTSVQVDEGDYVGRNVDEVAAELEGLGLNVSRDELDNPGDEDENTVEGVNPSGTLQEGDTVTVSYWGPPPPEPPPSTPTTPTTPPTDGTTDGATDTATTDTATPEGGA